MLEQKGTNKNVIEGSHDIENKSKGNKEEIVGVHVGKADATIINSKGNNTKKPNLLDTFKANIIDLVIIGGISTIGVFVADAILKLAGYFITQKFQMSFVIFMIVMVLYMSIMESGEKSTTIGQKISGLIITKG